MIALVSHRYSGKDFLSGDMCFRGLEADELVELILSFQIRLLQGKICLVFDICCWYLLSWLWCYYSSWSTKLVDY